ncbi:MAG: TetR/AcrR family transcriptional regulator [Rhodobiaceae bacterium]|nr:TetR/AcrR family transcriptional regulator [Rhodobiaceae bacterium]
MTIVARMPTKVEQSTRTRTRIISAAQMVFTRDGYAKASLADIVKKAKVTTGAIYHHFGGKKDLFTAVAEHLEQVILNEVTSTTPHGTTGWDALEWGALKTLEISIRPEIQRIVFREAPTVVGLTEWRAIEAKYAFGLMMQTLGSLPHKSTNETTPEVTAQILLGAVTEAAHAVALSDKPDQALTEAKATLTVMIRALENR